jgi:two-component system, NarL family, sensor kinase
MSTGPGVGALRLAAVRAVFAPVLVLGERLVDHPAEDRVTFLVLAGAFALWAAGLLALHLAARAGLVHAPAALERAEPFVDLAAIVALTYTSGGPFSQTGMAFFVLPLLAAARLRPAVTVRWAAAAVIAYFGLSALHSTAGEAQATSRMVSQLAYLA